MNIFRIIIAILILFISCTPLKFRKYFLERALWDAKNEYDQIASVYSSSEYSGFYFENAMLLKNVDVSNTLFDTTVAYGIYELSKYIKNGNEEYLFLFRNFISRCCDWFADVSFVD